VVREPRRGEDRAERERQRRTDREGAEGVAERLDQRDLDLLVLR
jgi:hypothetical protein